MTRLFSGFWAGLGTGRVLRCWGRALWLAALLLLAPLVSCDEGALDPEDSSLAPPREGYPAGPYGTSEGAVMADATFVNPDGSAFSLRELYADGANKLILLSTAAGWCTACIEEAPKLQQWHESHGERGLAVVVAYFEDASFNPATAESAGRWQTRHQLSHRVVADPSFLMAGYYDARLTPLNMIIEVETMEILWMTTGWDGATAEAIIRAKIR